MELVDDVRLRRADAPREGGELRGRNVLGAQGEYLMLVKRALQGGEICIRQWLRKVDAGSLDSETRGQRSKGDHREPIRDSCDRGLG